MIACIFWIQLFPFRLYIIKLNITFCILSMRVFSNFLNGLSRGTEVFLLIPYNLCNNFTWKKKFSVIFYLCLVHFRLVKFEFGTFLFGTIFVWYGKTPVIIHKQNFILFLTCDVLNTVLSIIKDILLYFQTN